MPRSSPSTILSHLRVGGGGWTEKVCEVHRPEAQAPSLRKLRPQARAEAVLAE